MKPVVFSGSLLLLLLFFWQWGGQFFYWDKGETEAGREEGRSEAVSAVLSVEDESTPPDFPVKLLYDKYLTTWVYLTVGGGGAEIRQMPDWAAPVLHRAAPGEKLSCVETVTVAAGSGSVETAGAAVLAGGDGAEALGGPPETWYHVMWSGPQEAQFGFISAGAVVSKRAYRFDKMEAAVRELDAWAATTKSAAEAALPATKPAVQAAPATLAHISNYKDYNGLAPAYKGGNRDDYGTSRSQAAPAYSRLDDKAEFRYLEDGTLLCVRGRVEGYTLVTVLYTGQIYYVPSRYVSETETLKGLERVVVVDRAMQNLAVFEKISGQWTVVSYTLATTGKQGAYSLPTPLGYYYAMEKRPEFYYIRDGTDQLQGYAPYAVRFCGGAYIHGVGVNYRQAADGSRVVPGPVEYSPTIGTVPLSHKCVRNYTSHAKFLYDRYTEGTTAVAVIE